VDGAITDTERNWAAIAHASTFLTALVGLATGGVGAILLALVPVGIYVAFRDRSRYVAFQALQAAVLQLTGLILYAIGLILLIVGTVVSWVLTVVLAVVLVGVLIAPIALLVTLVLVLFAVLFPLALLAYALYGAVEAGRGADFNYWWIGDWLLGMEPAWLPRGGGQE
jgi:hypothetical protein